MLPDCAAVAAPEVTNPGTLGPQLAPTQGTGSAVPASEPPLHVSSEPASSTQSTRNARVGRNAAAGRGTIEVRNIM